MNGTTNVRPPGLPPDPTGPPAREALAALAQSLDVAAEVQDRQDERDGVETVCNKARFMRRLAAEIRQAVSGDRDDPAGGRGRA